MTVLLTDGTNALNTHTHKIHAKTKINLQTNTKHLYATFTGVTSLTPVKVLCADAVGQELATAPLHPFVCPLVAITAVRTLRQRRAVPDGVRLVAVATQRAVALVGAP